MKLKDMNEGQSVASIDIPSNQERTSLLAKSHNKYASILTGG